MSTTPDQIIENYSESVHLRQLVISSFSFIHHSDECCWSRLLACAYVYGRVLSKLATGFFVMGLTRSWWEIPRAHWGWVKDERSWRGGGGVGAPTGALSHDDIVKQIRQGLLVAANTFVSGHSLPCFHTEQNPLSALEIQQHVQWHKAWYGCVCDFLGWMELTCHVREQRTHPHPSQR